VTRRTMFLKLRPPTPQSESVAGGQSPAPI
jgi:hypothetical protein